MSLLSDVGAGCAGCDDNGVDLGAVGREDDKIDSDGGDDDDVGMGSDE